MRRLMIVSAGSMMLVATGAAFADDFAPPWYRGLPLSVYAEWEFTQPIAGFDIYPEVFSSVGGNGTLYDGFATKAELESPNDWTWVPGDGDGGIAPTTTFGGVISFKVQNFIDQEPEKLLRIQFTFDNPLAFQPPEFIGAEGVFQGEPPILVPGSVVGGAVVDGRHVYWDLLFQPNPNWEHIDVIIPFGTVLDEVVIDSVSIPAPGALALLGAGLLAGRRRR